MKKIEIVERKDLEIKRLHGIIDFITDRRMEEVEKNIHLKSHLIMCRAALAELSGVLKALTDTAQLIDTVLEKTWGIEDEEISKIRTKQ